METTGKTQDLELEIALLKIELEHAHTQTKVWKDLFDISYNNTNAALKLCDYWKAKYDAVF